MKIRLSTDLVKLLRKIKNKDKILTNQISNKLKLFQVNAQHPSLRTHKLSGKMSNCWSISINKSLRIIYILLKSDEAYFIALGTHDEVYRR